jgi:hypothetical protein
VSGARSQEPGVRSQKTKDSGFRDLGIEELRDSGIRESKIENMLFAFNA